MSQKYPQVLRVGRDRVPALHGGRHNHCMTSPVYREKTLKINTPAGGTLFAASGGAGLAYFQ
jgi:beta-galactosidase GanA